MAISDAFMIVEVDIQGNDEVIVKGRAYLDILVGDVLYGENVNEELIEQCSKFVVEKITSYGKETPILSSVMTGNLLLKGVDTFRLSDCKMLHKCINDD
jgi:hypothetical protein